MSANIDFKKEWDKTKKQLVKFSKEAAEVMKKSEKELVVLSKKSKLHIDATTASLKKERLFYLIGKEYVKSLNTGKQNDQLKKYLKEFDQIKKEAKVLKAKIKSK